MMPRVGSCGRYQAALEAFVADEPAGPDTPAALDHLGRCDGCTAELENLALAIVGLRRIARDAAAAAEAPEDLPDDSAGGSAAWQALRARVTRGRVPAWRWRSQLAGVVLGASLVAAFVGPATLPGRPAGSLNEAGAVPGLIIDPTIQDVRGETAWFRQTDRARKERPIEPPTSTIRFDPGTYGEEARPGPSASEPPRGRTAQ